MKLWAGSTTIAFDPGHAFAMDGAVHFEGHYRPAPHTEGKLGMEMTFDEAKDLAEQLTRVLAELPCPHCGRKEKT